jgi:hypothetical protein
MQIFTTKAFTELPDADDMRSNGPGYEALIFENESGTTQLEATLEEVETALVDLDLEIDADVISEEVMTALVEHLISNCGLEVPA